jgi:hypothetical protein
MDYALTEDFVRIVSQPLELEKLKIADKYGRLISAPAAFVSF